MIDAGRVLDAVGEPNRRELLRLLDRHGESTVSTLVAESGMRQPQVSKHLKVLGTASLVAVRRNGRHRHYRLDPRGLRAAHDWFREFEHVWLSRFDALDRLVTDGGEPASPSPTPPEEKSR